MISDVLSSLNVSRYCVIAILIYLSMGKGSKSVSGDHQGIRMLDAVGKVFFQKFYFIGLQDELPVESTLRYNVDLYREEAQ